MIGIYLAFPECVQELGRQISRELHEFGRGDRRISVKSSIRVAIGPPKVSLDAGNV
jgi:hypothetical protein